MTETKRPLVIVQTYSENDDTPTTITFEVLHPRVVQSVTQTLTEATENGLARVLPPTMTMGNGHIIFNDMPDGEPLGAIPLSDGRFAVLENLASSRDGIENGQVYLVGIGSNQDMQTYVARLGVDKVSSAPITLDAFRLVPEAKQVGIEPNLLLLFRVLQHP